MGWFMEKGELYGVTTLTWFLLLFVFVGLIRMLVRHKGMTKRSKLIVFVIGTTIYGLIIFFRYIKI
ncbi:hypothetical protein C9426_24080 [Serratia sp. S1B]|nr:hypothetical protein C9426_24080 [Serratia sp. S1B]